jgi:predicted nucleic acid-binding protein
VDYVFDSSFIVALIIPDEKNLKVGKMYDQIQNEDNRHAPHLLWYEIANIFNNLIRRKRYTLIEVAQFFPQLSAFDLICDFETGIAYSEKLLALCSNYNISAYDAAYLELAERKNAILCTLDEGLRSAAEKHGVKSLK